MKIKTQLDHPSLQDGISKLMSDLAAFRSPDRADFVRFETEIASIDLLKWLDIQSNNVKIYWQDRTNDYAVAAIDMADCINSEGGGNDPLKGIEKRLQGAPSNSKYFGGLAFLATGKNDKIWDEFGKLNFILPRVEILRQNTKMYLACQLAGTPEEIKKTIAVLRNINTKLTEASNQLPLPKNRLDTPSQLLWENHAHEILDDIENNRCQKIVLARQVKLEFPGRVNPTQLLNQLINIASNCFCFLFQCNGRDTFLGASPERLYIRESKAIQTEALAGTRPRGRSGEEDDRLQDQLQSSEKDRNEQGLVIEMIEDSLLSLCKTFTHDPKPSLLNLNGSHHLITRFKGELKDDILDAKILSTLNPTPAVAGTPTDIALKTIDRLEPFSRGWYAGPIGYISRDKSEFCVAIRSGLLSQNNLFLYAGAGIVKGSVPHNEWEETENKLINFLKIFDAARK